MEDAVRGQGAPAVDRSLAPDVGHPPAGLFDHDRWRRQVPAVRPDLDHCLGRAFGHQRIAPEVAEATVTPGRSDQGREAGCQPTRLDIERQRIEDLASATAPTRETPTRRRSPAAGPTDPTAHVPPPRRAYQRSPIAGALMTPADDLAILLDREQRAEQRDAAHEVVGAVDRVDVPADAAGPGLGAVFLADKAVVREVP